MKNILFILFSTIGLSLSAQVGIATPTPNAMLDVNGNINLRGKLVVRNAADGKLLEGGDDQLLVSQGAGLAPTWKSLRIPDYEANKFYLIYNNSFSDRVGTTFTSSDEPTITSRSASFTKNSNISNFSKFKKIPGLSQTFNVYSSESKTYFQFETVIQANFATVGTTDTSIDYACGIFVDDKLVNLRQGNLRAINSSNPFLTHNQIGLAQNLSKGAHSVSVACSRLKSYNVPSGITLGIGTSVSDNIDSFISQSSFKIDVYEVPQVFNAITN